MSTAVQNSTSMIADMTKLLDQGIEAVRSLPVERQDVAGELLLAMACQQRAGYSLSPDQIEDIKLAAVEAIAENSQPMPRCRRCGANAAYEAALYAARAAASRQYPSLHHP